MLGPLLRVARPDDWTGMLARVVVVLAFVLAIIPVLLAQLPAAWVALAMGQPIVVRGVLLLAILPLVWAARTWLMARLPRAAVLSWRTVRFHDGTRRVALPVDRIAALHVEQRPEPAHEVFVIEARDGSEHDLCPTHWFGAPRLHRALDRRVAAAARRRARAERRRSSPRRAAGTTGGASTKSA